MGQVEKMPQAYRPVRPATTQRGGCEPIRPAAFGNLCVDDFLGVAWVAPDANWLADGPGAVTVLNRADI
jgi:hypothetical protein